MRRHQRRRRPPVKRVLHRINDKITAPEVRVIADEGENIGVIPTADALKKAKEAGLDLVEIAPKADPPVCKIVDYQKFLFTKKKQERKAKSGSKKSELKTFRFGPSIGEHDLELKLKRARGFLEKNNKVKFTIQFKGRQNVHPEVGEERLNRITQALADIARVEVEPKKQGRFMSMVLMPK